MPLRQEPELKSLVMKPANFTIRPAQAADAPGIQAIYAPIVADTVISFEERPPSVEEMAERITGTLENYPYLVAEGGEGQVLGFAYAGPHRTRAAYRLSVDVTAYVSAEARGLGIGKALYKELLSALTTRGFHAAFAGIALPNEASLALHRSVGFEAVGVYREVGFKFGKRHDVSWWQRLL